jgi:hypothetical protein
MFQDFDEVIDLVHGGLFVVLSDLVFALFLAIVLETLESLTDTSQYGGVLTSKADLFASQVGVLFD